MYFVKDFTLEHFFYISQIQLNTGSFRTDDMQMFSFIINNCHKVWQNNYDRSRAIG